MNGGLGKHIGNIKKTACQIHIKPLPLSNTSAKCVSSSLHNLFRAGKASEVQNCEAGDVQFIKHYVYQLRNQYRH